MFTHVTEAPGPGRVGARVVGDALVQVDLGDGKPVPVGGGQEGDMVLHLEDFLVQPGQQPGVVQQRQSREEVIGGGSRSGLPSAESSPGAANPVPNCASAYS